MHERQYPVGSIDEAAHSLDAKFVLKLKPLALAFRPLVPRMGGCAKADLILEPGHEVIDGRQCLLVRDPSRFTRLWVDPSRDFVIVRYDLRGTRTVGIRYQEDPLYGWIPSGWNLRFLSKTGELRHAYRCEVADIKINPMLNIDDFRLSFAPGTVVQDSRNRTMYFVRQDGSKRMLTPTEQQGLGTGGYNRIVAEEAR